MSRGFESVIGLEVHAQLKTLSKIFCGDSTQFEAGDNENTSPVSVGMPGTLPTLNARVVEQAIKAGLALQCHIRPKSVFARKNYFYPDLPKGYQISQYDQPICEKGLVEFKLEGKIHKIKIERAHLEEDAGKSSHFGDYTLLNYNRSGIPLLEIVSGPDMRSPAEAAEYARNLRLILRYLDVCDGNLEEGSLRCDCNISVRKIGETKLGTKVEIKNINSFRFIEKALEYEIERQIECVERGEKIIQETRLWDPDKNKTFSMRSKEDAQDYRYFPDPDLLPIIVSEELLSKIKKDVTELPLARAQRFISLFGIPEADADAIVTDRQVADYFEDAGKVSGNYKSVANWIMTELLRELNDAKINIRESKVSAKNLGELVKLIDSGEISGKIAKTIFSEMWKSGAGPGEIVKSKGLSQISDVNVIEKMIDEVLAANASQVQDYRSGKTKLLGFFVGAAMKASKGQANPDLVNQILQKKLQGKS